jgi:hypothetical protein
VTALVLMVLAVEPIRLDARRESGAEGCPDEQQLQRAVAERLGENPFSSDASRAVVVRWRNQGGVFSSEVTVTGASSAPAGSKRLTSTATDCNDLAASTALALALIIDPLSISRPPAQVEPELQPPPPPPPTPPLEEPLPPTPPAPLVGVDEPALTRPPAPSTGGFWLGGEAGVSADEVPNVSATVSFSLAVSWATGMFGGRATFVVPGSKAFDEGSVAATVVGVGPFLCLGSSRVGGCAAVRLGATYAWASGYADSTFSGAAASLAFSLGPYLDFAPTSNLKLRFFANALLQPVATTLLVRGAVAWRTPIFALNVGVSLFGRP